MNTEKLPSEFKEKWIKALRSGNYEQGQGCLKHNDKYCCLGVACEIESLNPGSEEWPDLLNGSNLLPEVLIIGSSKYSFSLSPEEQLNPLCRLASMNDQGYTFIQIANWIEKNL